MATRARLPWETVSNKVMSAQMKKKQTDHLSEDHFKHLESWKQTLVLTADLFEEKGTQQGLLVVEEA